MSTLDVTSLNADVLLAFFPNENKEGATAPHTDPWEMSALAELVADVRSYTDEQLTLKEAMTSFYTSFMRECAAHKLNMEFNYDGQDYMKSLSSTKKLYLKAAACAILVREKMERIMQSADQTVRAITAAVEFLVNNCSMQRDDVERDISLIRFTWAVQTACSMGLPLNRTHGLCVQIGIFLDGNGIYYVRGGTGRPAKPFAIRTEVCDTLYATLSPVSAVPLRGTVRQALTPVLPPASQSEQSTTQVIVDSAPRVSSMPQLPLASHNKPVAGHDELLVPPPAATSIAPQHYYAATVSRACCVPVIDTDNYNSVVAAPAMLCAPEATPAITRLSTIPQQHAQPLVVCAPQKVTAVTNVTNGHVVINNKRRRLDDVESVIDISMVFEDEFPYVEEMDATTFLRPRSSIPTSWIQMRDARWATEDEQLAKKRRSDNSVPSSSHGSSKSSASVGSSSSSQLQPYDEFELDEIDGEDYLPCLDRRRFQLDDSLDLFNDLNDVLTLLSK